eukprot:3118475-Rhodomonas_salina.2
MTSHWRATLEPARAPRQRRAALGGHRSPTRERPSRCPTLWRGRKSAPTATARWVLREREEAQRARLNPAVQSARRCTHVRLRLTGSSQLTQRQLLFKSLERRRARPCDIEKYDAADPEKKGCREAGLRWLVWRRPNLKGWRGRGADNIT